MYQQCAIPKQKNIVKFEIEKFYPGPGIEPGPLALCASALTITPSRTSTSPR